MFSSIFSFEVRRLLRSASTYIYFVVLIAVTAFVAMLAGGMFPEAKFAFGGEKIYANAPVIVDAFFSFINNYVGLIIIVAIVGNAVLKDFKFNTYSMIFTTPVTRFNYLSGRFAASMMVAMLVLTGPAFGLMIGYAMPGLNPDRIGAFMLAPYIHTYWQTIVPNTLIFGSIFFAVSLISRDILVIWLSLIAFFVANGVASSTFSSLELRSVAALADPMGTFAKRTLTRYWSTHDKNHQVMPMEGLFLVNRLLWLGISVGIWAIGYRFFSFSSTPRRISFRAPRPTVASGKMSFVPAFFRKGSLPHTNPDHSTRAMLQNMWGLSVNECKTLIRNTSFRIILSFGMTLLLLVSTQIGKIYDTTTYPVTYTVVEYFSGTFNLFMVILTILFSGELVWRAREHRMSNILDALPVPNWVFYISKLSGLLFMQVILQTIVVICGMIVQVSKGYTNFEIGVYIKYAYGFGLIDLWLLSVLAIFIQTLSSNKFLGYFIVALFYFWNSTFASLVLKHKLFIFSSDPGIMYSDMNAFGHLTYPYFIFKLYWGALSVALAGLTSLLWARGTEKKLGLRLADARHKENRRSWVLVAGALLVFIGCGSFIYYNTDVLNKNLTDTEQEKKSVDYEKRFARYKGIPQPKITDVKLNVDIYPQQRSLHTAGTYVLQNKTDVPVDSIHILMPEDIKVRSMTLARSAKQVYYDSTVSYRILRLDQPLRPGDTLTLSFVIDMVSKGIEHSFDGLSKPLYNGTFVNNRSFLPMIGYSTDFELSDNSDRKKYGLGYRATGNAIGDTVAWKRNLFIHDADFVTLEVTMSTVPDQIAVAPGYLLREWSANGRRYFHYKMDNPILNFYSFMSARYKVKKDKWNNTNIEIYYHPGHEYNLDRMIGGIKKSLTYYTQVFSPYQHRQVRILEFPRYATFAQSFPNTIPFSEGLGFIADVTADKDNVDYPFYVTAHEVAHQWFAHQVIGADVEGSNLLSESLAQYGSIMVLEREYGEEKLRKFLKIEMDKYLSTRSSESEKERPWMYADVGQGYILYQKGGIQMHALNKYLGEDSMNHAIKRFIDKYAFQGPPYPTTRELVNAIRQSTPDSMQYFVTDAFEKITLYDNKLTEAKLKGAEGNYSVDVTVDSKKMYADSTGKETDAPGSNYVEIGVYKKTVGASEGRKKLAYIAKYKLAPGVNKLNIPLTFKPYQVIVDPRVLLIDRKQDDNEMYIDKDEKGEKKESSGSSVRAQRG
ncbi:M1 family aminopeptidase [Nemorincola caseinilytica]|uniref:M1 family aminopeptidase n=1 Tax=Nemorincola caseinilytica TaxID=2054315 RepID=A0ABP8N898_9BACT